MKRSFCDLCGDPTSFSAFSGGNEQRTFIGDGFKTLVYFSKIGGGGRQEAADVCKACAIKQLKATIKNISKLVAH